jgi:hypothetical protein
MVVLSVRRALFGELDLVGAFEVIDLSDRFPVRGDDVHVLPDLRGIRHCALLKCFRLKNAAMPERLRERRAAGCD